MGPRRRGRRKDRHQHPVDVAEEDVTLQEARENEAPDDIVNSNADNEEERQHVKLSNDGASDVVLDTDEAADDITVEEDPEEKGLEEEESASAEGDNADVEGVEQDNEGAQVQVVDLAKTGDHSQVESRASKLVIGQQNLINPGKMTPFQRRRWRIQQRKQINSNSQAEPRTASVQDGLQCFPAIRKERLVVFAGPGKTGSTTIQDTYIENANARTLDKRLPAFQNWTVPATSRFLPHCNYFINPFQDSRIRSVKSFETHFHALTQQQSTPQNVFWACEFGASIFDRDRSGDAVRAVIKSLGSRCPEFVFNYRTPRVDHFLSGWKERTAVKSKRVFKKSVQDFVCDAKCADHFTDSIQQYTNVLRGVVRYRQMANTNFPITIIDMGGAKKAGRDVTHVIACDILGVPCHNGTVSGMEISFANSKKMRKNGVLPKEQMDAIERLFRLRDCFYRDLLVNDPQVRVLHNDTLWYDCPDPQSDAAKAYADMENDDYFIEELRSIFRCKELGYNSNWTQFVETSTAERKAKEEAEKADEKTSIYELSLLDPLSKGKSKVLYEVSVTHKSGAKDAMGELGAVLQALQQQQPQLQLPPPEAFSLAPDYNMMEVVPQESYHLMLLVFLSCVASLLYTLCAKRGKKRSRSLQSSRLSIRK